ncbi:MAG: hypothetical protein ACKVT0_07875 [Planctomycetaceae bacterium]
MTKQTNSPYNERREPTGIGRDIHRLKEHGSMSLAELQEFVRTLHGRSPSEVLGIVSSSALIRATIEATAYTCGLLLILTVVPFFMGGDEDAKAVAPTSSAASNEANDPAAPVNTATAATAGSDGEISTEDAQKAVDVMGLGETKAADPNKNPLDNLDNLLDDVK